MIRSDLEQRAPQVCVCFHYGDGRAASTSTPRQSLGQPLEESEVGGGPTAPLRESVPTGPARGDLSFQKTCQWESRRPRLAPVSWLHANRTDRSSGRLPVSSRVL